MKQHSSAFPFTVSGLPVTVTKKNIKHLYIRLKTAEGRVYVSAPRHMPDEAILRFVQTKAAWIEAKSRKQRHNPPAPEMQYQSGETLYVWGKPFTLQVQAGSKNTLTLIGESAVLTMKPGAAAAQRAAFVHEWYREILKGEIARRLPKWEAITGLTVREWRTKRMKTRWGTCNPKAGRIWLSVHLAKKPPDCLDYVIVHELMHLRERGHNARFYALMDRYMPRWRSIKAALNQKPYRGTKEHNP